jgi:hypothetical protein
MALAFLRGRRDKPCHKYRAKPVRVDGVWFDSQSEYRRWTELQALEKIGAVRGLNRQVSFPLHAAAPSQTAELVGVLRVDFVYCERHRTVGGDKWRAVVEDRKGVRTALYRWKKRHFELEYRMTLRET